ncbi:GTP-binding protein [Candidatus Micrarchaeota archaeon]|nr:GTP-binding protein [Candidatus Micrarchaeota archaeon]
MGLNEKITSIEEELHGTKYHKGTERHIGLLKAKLAKLKKDASKPKGKGGIGFDIKKTGDATVVLVGLPSVGKSTLINKITNAESAVAEYEFTTLEVIPGVLEYKGAQIQVLDLPGVISGAAEGKGRGREVLAVARTTDLIIIILDVFQPMQLNLIKNELEAMGIRLDKEPPRINLNTKQRGGILINSQVKLTQIDQRTIQEILNIYGIHNGDLVLNDDITADDLIDFLVGNRCYVKTLVAVNKIDLVDQKYLDHLRTQIGHFMPIAADRDIGLENLREEIYNKLSFIRVYTKPKFKEVDYSKPLILKKRSTLSDVCDKIHRNLKKEFKYSLIWGKSAKFPGQRVGLDHIVEDEDVISIVSK